MLNADTWYSHPKIFNQACSKDLANLKADLAYAGEIGFEGIELRFDCLEAYMQQGGTLKEVITGLATHCLKAGPVNALYLHPALLTGPSGHPAVELFNRHLTLLQRLHDASLGKINQVIMVAPLLKCEQETTSFSKEEIFDLCTILLDRYARELPEITLCFEPVGLRRSLVRTASFAAKISRAITQNNLGLVLDSCNLFLADEKYYENLPKLSPDEIKIVHLMSGNLPKTDKEIIDQSWRRFAGDGQDVPIAPFIKRLHDLGYNGPISAEVFCKEYEQLYSHQEIIRRAYASLKQALFV